MDELASLQESARLNATLWAVALGSKLNESARVRLLGTPLLAQEKATDVARNEEPMIGVTPPGLTPDLKGKEKYPFRSPPRLSRDS